MLPLTVPVSNDISNHTTLVGSLSVLNPALSFNIELVQYNTTNTTTLVNVHYKSSCSSDEILTEESILPKKSFSPLQISQFIHAGLNYHGNNTPINLATRSYLMYNIGVSYINQGCLRLYLIRTADAYFTFIERTENKGNIVYKFSITTLQDDFYIAYEAQDTNFSSEVSGKEVHYIFSSLHTPCLTPLSMENPTHPMQCIFISSDFDEIDVVGLVAHIEISVPSEQPLFSDAAAYLILIISLVILVIAVIVMIIGIPTVMTLLCDRNCELYIT